MVDLFIFFVFRTMSTHIISLVFKITNTYLVIVTSLSLMNQVILAGGFEGDDEQFALNFSPRVYCGLSSCNSGLPSIVPEKQTMQYIYLVNKKKIKNIEKIIQRLTVVRNRFDYR